MRHHMMSVLVLIGMTACASPGNEFVGKWAPATSLESSNDRSFVDEDALEIRRDGKRFHVTMDGAAVPAHLTENGQLKVDGIIPLELSYSKEKDSLYLLGVQLVRLDE